MEYAQGGHLDVYTAVPVEILLKGVQLAGEVMLMPAKTFADTQCLRADDGNLPAGDYAHPPGNPPLERLKYRFPLGVRHTPEGSVGNFSIPGPIVLTAAQIRQRNREEFPQPSPLEPGKYHLCLKVLNPVTGLLDVTWTPQLGGRELIVGGDPRVERSTSSQGTTHPSEAPRPPSPPHASAFAPAPRGQRREPRSKRGSAAAPRRRRPPRRRRARGGLPRLRAASLGGGDGARRAAAAGAARGGRKRGAAARERHCAVGASQLTAPCQHQHQHQQHQRLQQHHGRHRCIISLFVLRRCGTCSAGCRWTTSY